MPPHLASLCLCYHKLRWMPSFYSGLRLPSHRRMQTLPWCSSENSASKSKPLQQLSIPIPYTICKAAREGHGERSMAVTVLFLADMASLILDLKQLDLVTSGAIYQRHLTILMGVLNINSIIWHLLIWHCMPGADAKHSHTLPSYNSYEMGTVYIMPLPHLWGLKYIFLILLQMIVVSYVRIV